MMPMGTSLSRWTMSYFAAALFFLLLAEGLLAAGGWAPSFGVTEPCALIIVHSTTIGWLLLLMIGALLQFGPVLTGLELPKGNLGLMVLFSIVLGLVLLLSGFGLIDAGSSYAGPTMTVAAAVLVASILSIAAMLFSLLWRGRYAHEASPYVLLGIASLVATVGLGALFAIVLPGVVSVPTVVKFVVAAVPLHAGFGLVGWMTFAAVGVSYKLLPMFLLSDDMKHSRTLLRSCIAVVGLLALSACALTVDETFARILGLLAAAFFLLAGGAYVVELVHAYRTRRRKVLEVNTYWSLPAFAIFGVSAAFFPVAMLAGADERIFVSLTYLFVFGWLTGLGLAQLLKIVPFLTWIEAFGPLLGRRPTPKLADLVHGGRASVWFTIFYSAVVVAAAAILFSQDGAFRVAVLAQTLSTGAIAVELALSRALACVDADTKKSPFKHPAFFFAGNHRGDANGSAS
ncbi:hypothetical protein FZ934_20345 (plasmid) [Rhizobium grahamii]|uniref:Transmembrane protein n=2 Tax=Rhizobium/Agrobacterium group TaxID=227290 RepID=A0A5Q0C9U3_9HYPH|nr:hypothetical protein FZ934_20345 [Rhizobium grahamii]QRM52525.1 hypothetical protein F3Y33_25315 [Rhizobium sp. BG6]